MAKVGVVFDTAGYDALRTNAHATASRLFDADAANNYWDRLYIEAVR